MKLLASSQYGGSSLMFMYSKSDMWSVFVRIVSMKPFGHCHSICHCELMGMWLSNSVDSGFVLLGHICIITIISNNHHHNKLLWLWREHDNMSDESDVSLLTLLGCNQLSDDNVEGFKKSHASVIVFLHLQLVEGRSPYSYRVQNVGEDLPSITGWISVFHASSLPSSMAQAMA